MKHTRWRSLITEAHHAIESAPEPGGEDLDELLTDCAGEILSLQAEIRALQRAAEEMVAATAELRRLRNLRAIDSAAS